MHGSTPPPPGGLQSPSTIVIILRTAEVIRGSDRHSHAKIRFQYFLRKTILCQKKLFVAVHERHYNMKACTDLLNNRMLKTTEQRNQTKKLPSGHHKTFLKTLSKSHNFVTFIVFLLKLDQGVSVHVASALFS